MIGFANYQDVARTAPEPMDLPSAKLLDKEVVAEAFYLCCEQERADNLLSYLSLVVAGEENGNITVKELLDKFLNSEDKQFISEEIENLQHIELERLQKESRLEWQAEQAEARCYGWRD